MDKVKEFCKAVRDLGMFDETMAIMREHGRDPEVLTYGEPMLQLRNQGQVLGEEREGYTIVASGRWEGKKLFASRVEVIEPIDAPAQFDGVVGEIKRRTENILHVDSGDGEVTVVEVLPDAEIVIPGMPGIARVDQLKHHLEIQRMSKTRATSSTR
jgi:hypothetical protein